MFKQGGRMLKQPDGANSTESLIGALALGLLVIHFLYLIPAIGCLVCLASTLLGLGMMVSYTRQRFNL